MEIYQLWRIRTCQLWQIPSFVIFTILLLAFLSIVTLWNAQQTNINSLEYEIKNFTQEISQPSSNNEWSKPEERLILKKDLLIIKKDTTIIKDAAYTTLVQALGGIIVAITAYVGYRNLKVGEETLKIGQKNLKVTEDKQVTERFSKSIEHLSSDKIEICLGGIYALEQIAIDSPEKYHWTIVEILSAFVREKCQVEESATDSSKSNLDSEEATQEIRSEATSLNPKKIGIDIQAALTVIGKRKVEQDPPMKSIDLIKVNLMGLELHNANLSRVNLWGANLRKARLIDVDLSNTLLEDTDFSNASFKKVNLCGAELAGAKLMTATFRNANFKEADLNGAHLNDTNFYDTNFCNASFFDTKLDNASFWNSDFSTCHYLTRSQLDTAYITTTCKLPNDLLPYRSKIIN